MGVSAAGADLPALQRPPLQWWSSKIVRALGEGGLPKWPASLAVGPVCHCNKKEAQGVCGGLRLSLSCDRATSAYLFVCLAWARVETVGYEAGRLGSLFSADGNGAVSCWQPCS